MSMLGNPKFPAGFPADSIRNPIEIVAWGGGGRRSQSAGIGVTGNAGNNFDDKGGMAS